MPKTQTKTPTEKAQIALAKADEHLAKQRERLAKIAAKAGETKGKLDALREQHDTLANEIAFSERSRDLLATHPLLRDGGTPEIAAREKADAVFEVPADSGSVEIVGQTSIADFSTTNDDSAPVAPAGIRVIENQNGRSGVFTAVPSFEAEPPEETDGGEGTDDSAPFEL